MGRASRLDKKLLKCAGTDSANIYRKNLGVFRVKNAQTAPRFVSFCSMYGNELSYSLENAELATVARLGRGGTFCELRAPPVPNEVEGRALPSNLQGSGER